MTLNIFYHKIVFQERINSSQFYLPGGHLHCTALPVRANQKIPWQLWAVNMEPLIHNQLNALCLARRLPMPCHHCHPGLDTNIFGITSSNRFVAGQPKRISYPREAGGSQGGVMFVQTAFYYAMRIFTTTNRRSRSHNTFSRFFARYCKSHEGSDE